MGRIKKTQNVQKPQRRHRRRKSNISELVYQYLGDEAVRDAKRSFATKCHCCDRGRSYEEVVDSADSPRTANMSYRVRRKSAGRTSRVKRRSTSRTPTASYAQKYVGGEGSKKAKIYVKRALDFGVDSGYLIPADSARKVLRVSSALMRNDSRRNKISTCDGVVSQEQDKSTRDGPTKLDDLQEQGRRRRRRRRRGRRSRSGSRRRGGRRRRRRSSSRSRSRSRSKTKSRSKRFSSPQNPEVVEDEADDYEMDENDPKTNIHTDDVEREPKTARSDSPDEEQSTKKAGENASDLSVDEDEDTDDEEDKKETNAPET